MSFKISAKLSKTKAYVLALVMLMNALSSPQAHADPAVREQIQNQITEVLVELGYQDDAAKAFVAMESPKSSPVAKAALREQMERFQIKNIARDLTAQAVAAAVERMNAHPDQAEKISNELVRVATDLIKLRPTIPTDGLPPEIETIENDKLRKEAIQNWAEKVAKNEMNEAKVRLVSNLAALIYGETELKSALGGAGDARSQKVRNELAALEKNAAEYLMETWSHSELSRTQYLGRAFALAISAESAIESQHPVVGKLKSKLKESFLKDGEYLENYTTNSFTYKDPETGKVVTKALRNGDVFMIHPGFGEGANQATAAIANGGTNPFMSALYQIANVIGTSVLTNEEKLYEKILLKQPLTWWERFSHGALLTSAAKKGYSRAGLINSKTVKLGNDSKLSTTWIQMSTDSPGGHGGVIGVGVEQFAGVAKIGIAELNDQELAKHFINTMEERQRESGKGTIQAFKDGSIYEVSEDKKTLRFKNKNAQHEWIVSLSEIEQQELFTLARTSPLKFARKYRALAVRQMEAFANSEQAVVYGKGQTGSNVLSSGSAVVKAYEVATGVAPNPKKDSWSLIARINRFFGGVRTRGLNMKETPVAPGTMAEQGKLSEEFVIDTARGRNEIALHFNKLGAVRPPVSVEVTRLVRSEMQITSANLECDRYAEVISKTLALTQMGAVAGSTAVLPFMETKYTRSRGKNVDTYIEQRINELTHSTVATSYGDLTLTHDAAARVEEYDRELKSWDFFDATDRIKQSIAQYDKNIAETGKGKQGGLRHIVNRYQAERNLVRFQTLDTSREMAAFVMAELSNRLTDPKVQVALADLTARMLTMKPAHPPVLFPHHILAMPKDTPAQQEARMEAIEEYVEYDRRQRMEAQTRAVTADVVNLLYGTNFTDLVADGVRKGDPNALKWQTQIGEIYKRCFTFVRHNYMSDTSGKANDFGQALGALINIEVAKDADGKLALLDKSLREGLHRQNAHWENFYGREFVQLNEKGQLVRTDIKGGNMIMVLTASIANSEGPAIPTGANAANKFGPGGAYWSGMYRPSAGLVAMLTHAFKTDSEVLEDGQTWKEKLKDRAFQLAHVFNERGESHINYIYYRPKKVIDSAGKEKTIWRAVVVDAYPDHDADNTGELRNAGGPRLSSVLQIVDRAFHNAVRIAWRDSVLERKIFIQSIIKRRSQPELFDEFGYPKDGVAYRPMFDVEYGKEVVKPVANSLQPEAMMTRISREDYIKHHFPGGIEQLEQEISEVQSKFKRFAPGKERRKQIQEWHDRQNEMVYHAKVSTIVDESWIFQWVDAAIGVEPNADFAQWKEKHLAKFLDAGFKETEVYEMRAAILADNPKAVARIIRAHVYGTTYCSLYDKLTSLMATMVDPEGAGGGGYVGWIKFVGKVLDSFKAKAAENRLKGEKSPAYIEKAAKLAEGMDAIVTAAHLKGTEDVCSPVALVHDSGVPNKQNIRMDMENRTLADRGRVGFNVHLARQASVKDNLDIILPHSSYALGETFEMDNSDAHTMMHNTLNATKGKRVMQVGMTDAADSTVLGSLEVEEEEKETEKPKTKKYIPEPQKAQTPIKNCVQLFAQFQ